jgi:pantoate--beta-alanine ligase
LEGEHRPSHFQGVATVVLKLFELVQPAIAYFGQKDYQQSLVVRHMVRDLNVPVQIAVCPTVRDVDGVALSSRNRYLNSAQRAIARSLHQCLRRVRQAVLEGERDGKTLMSEMNRALIAEGVASIDYAVLCDSETLEVLPVVRRPAVALLACHVGTTRLIDNILIE